MSRISAFVKVALLALSSLAFVVPAPPFEAFGEIVSVAMTFSVFMLALLLTRMRRWSLVRIGVLAVSLVVARIAAELNWELALTVLPDAFFVLPRLVGADGEGAYNLASYQAFLLVSLAMISAIVAMWPNNSFKPTPLRGAA